MWVDDKLRASKIRVFAARRVFSESRAMRIFRQMPYFSLKLENTHSRNSAISTESTSFPGFSLFFLAEEIALRGRGSCTNCWSKMFFIDLIGSISYSKSSGFLVSG